MDDVAALAQLKAVAFSLGLRLFRRVYKRCHEIARAEITGSIGLMWRGGRVQWPFLLPGHGYELMQPGVYTFTTTDIPANADTSNVVTVDYPIGYDTAGAAPAVFATSQDSDWIASATPNGSNPHTQVDLSAARRTSLTTPEWDTTAGTIAAGDTYVDVTVTFTPHFQSTPVALASVSNPQCRPTLQAVSTTGATFRVSYVPSLAVGTIASNTTGITGANNGGAESLSSGGPSDNESNLTTTNTDSTGGPSTPDTSTGSVNHHHSIPAGTDAGGGTSGDTDPSHHHTLSSHTHGVGDHSHGMKHHTHGVDTTDHTHGITDPGHTHTFTGSAETAPSDTAFTLQWTAIGLRASTATTVDVSWLAVGLQALPS